MGLKGQILICVVALSAPTQSGWGQTASLWRAFKATDGLADSACASVTVGAQGTVFVQHFNTPLLTKLDGYVVEIIASPKPGSGRIYESRAGQLWAAAPDGLQEFRAGQWVSYPIPEIAAQSRASNSTHLKDVPLFPVRHGQVLFLLSDRLMSFNAEDPEHARTETLRLAAQTRIGDFFGMTPASDGGLWISGVRGLAKLPAPARNLKPDTGWQEFEVPNANWENLRHPRENALGRITVLAESPRDRKPLVVQFDGRQWTTQAAGTEFIRFAWTGPDQTCWAVTTNKLFAQRGDSGEMLPDEDVFAREFFDVASEPGGVFWLATSDGLFRHAPPVWRTPNHARQAGGSIHTVTEDSWGRLWFITANELHSVDEERHQVFPFPENLRQKSRTPHKLVSLRNGSLLLDTEEQLFLFRPLTGKFEPFSPQGSDNRVKLLGLLKDGIACVQRSQSGAQAEEFRLETYDGENVAPFARVPQGDGNLIAVFQARNGDVWVSKNQAVLRLRDDQWKNFSAAEKNVPQDAQFFTESSDGRVWCATVDTLWVFDGRIWALIRTGLNHINALAYDSGDNLWLASNSGLWRLTSSGAIENGIEEGLPSATVRSVNVDRQNRVWAGTSQGLSLYHPEADLDPPRTTILKPADRRIPEGGAVTITFHAQDKWNFTPRNRLLFSHRLDLGDWSPFQEANSVLLTDLPAGEHGFQVRAMDRNGNIESKAAQLLFTVALPWYREVRLVAIGAAGLAAAVFFAALAYNRHRQLRRSYANVEQQVAERTRELELAGRELLHSQKMNALGTLAAGVAHDFNNTLSIIKGSTQIIEENSDNPEIRASADRIKTAVDQGTRVVQAMLGFSRSSDEQLSPCDLNIVVEDTLNLLGGRFRREVEISFERATSLPEIPVAKHLIQQILLNFIFNAAEAMTKQKQVKLAVRLLDKTPSDLILLPAKAASYVSISVRDFGCGITPENLPRVFEPFFTTKALSARRGTGLGLSVAYELAKKMGAGLMVESVVNRGSTFVLILPAPDLLPLQNDFTREPSLTAH